LDNYSFKKDIEYASTQLICYKKFFMSNSTLLQ